jgi:hypothetical protein
MIATIVTSGFKYLGREKMIVGFTGTRKGMTDAQKTEVKNLLQALLPSDDSTKIARHGDCVGADADFDIMATLIGYTTIPHPASDVAGKWRAHLHDERAWVAKPALQRNHTIVNLSDIMIACPKSHTEEFRGSGTWATIRYTRKQKQVLYLIYPDGVIEQTDWR